MDSQENERGLIYSNVPVFLWRNR